MVCLCYFGQLWVVSNLPPSEPCMWVTLCLLLCDLHVVTFLVDVQNHGNHLEITYYQGAISIFYLLCAFSCPSIDVCSMVCGGS
jgi:hypothetical protein